MLDSGFSQLLSSDVTRTVVLSNGYSLIFDKTRIKDIAQKEDEIVRKRGSIFAKAKEIQDSLAMLESREIKDSLLRALESSVKELATRPSFSYADERIDFNMSSYGEAYSVFLATRRNTPEMKTVDDAIILLESLLTQEDREQIDLAMRWSSEVDALKNSDSPSEPEDSQKASSPSSDGEV